MFSLLSKLINYAQVFIWFNAKIIFSLQVPQAPRNWSAEIWSDRFFIWVYRCMRRTIKFEQWAVHIDKFKFLAHFHLKIFMNKMNHFPQNVFWYYKTYTYIFGLDFHRGVRIVFLFFCSRFCQRCQQKLCD